MRLINILLGTIFVIVFMLFWPWLILYKADGNYCFVAFMELMVVVFFFFVTSDLI